MKRLFLLATVLFATNGLRAQNTDFTIKGRVSGFDSGYIRLGYQGTGARLILDSAIIKGGTFEFKGKLDEPVMAYLMRSANPASFNDPNFSMIFIEPGNLVMELNAGDFKNVKLKGSRAHDEMAAAAAVKKRQLDQLLVLSAAYDQANLDYNQAKKAGKSEDELQSLKDAAELQKQKMGPLGEEMEKLDLDYIKTHPNSYYSAYALSGKTSTMPLTLSKTLYAQLSEPIKQSFYGKKIASDLQRLQGGSPGSVAGSFSAMDINGAELKLASYKGEKYVLLDFWASWCVPCRKGNPHLLSLYSKYKGKGFEIIGIASDDGNEQVWKKAVEQDNIGVWKHVLRGLKSSGGKSEQSNDINYIYKISTLPTKILIDKNGIIIGRYGGGGESDEAMDKKLAEIFGS